MAKSWKFNTLAQNKNLIRMYTLESILQNDPLEIEAVKIKVHKLLVLYGWLDKKNYKKDKESYVHFYADKDRGWIIPLITSIIDVYASELKKNAANPSFNSKWGIEAKATIAYAPALKQLVEVEREFYNQELMKSESVLGSTNTKYLLLVASVILVLLLVFKKKKQTS